jgi:hypothetical protein
MGRAYAAPKAPRPRERVANFQWLARPQRLGFPRMSGETQKPRGHKPQTTAPESSGARATFSFLTRPIGHLGCM